VTGRMTVCHVYVLSLNKLCYRLIYCHLFDTPDQNCNVISVTFSIQLYLFYS